MKFVTTLFFLFCASAAFGDTPSSTVMGDWVGPTKAIVRVHPCGSAVCVKLIHLSNKAPGKLDASNPESSLRTRSLCGLDIGTGFRKTDEAHLKDGHLYDPESGHTYSGIIVADGDKLNLRGYFGISLIGRSETWQRVAPADEKSCE